MDEAVLNTNQRKASLHLKKPMLVLAGPGSGKTTVVVYRIKTLIEKYKIHPSEILVITFTKSAAVEMENRYKSIKMNGMGVTFGTFHSLFYRIIRQAYGYTMDNILGEDIKWNVIRSIVRELELEINDEDEYIKDFISQMSIMRNDLIDIRDYNPDGFSKEELIKIYSKYDEFKARENKIDFDDMLTECYALFKNDSSVLKKWQDKYKFILIDEFQDINRVQYECIKLLALPENNIFAVGDDDQSIYKFRGAKPEILMEFANEYKDCEKIVLDVNYRSTESIIKLSAKVISNNVKRFEKNIIGTGRSGNLTEFFSAEDTGSEALRIAQKIKTLNENGIPFREMAVIFRTNLQAGSFTRVFMDNGIAYNLKDNISNVYEHWITKDIIAYISLALDESSNESFVRVINKPKRYISKSIISGIGNKSGAMLKNIFLSPELKTWQSSQIVNLQQNLVQIKKLKPHDAVKYIREVIGYDSYLQEYSNFRKANLPGLMEIADEITQTAGGEETLLDFMRQIKKLGDSLREGKNTSKKPNDNAVTLSTMHSAKGLEFEAVFIPSMIEGIIPHEKSIDANEIEEERRLFYVGVTRAKTFLSLSEISKRYDHDTVRSRFLTELGLVRKK